MRNEYTENEDVNVNGTESEHEDFLLLFNQANGKIYYAFRLSDSYRIVTVTDKFTEAAEQALRREDCTPSEAEALGLKCLFLPFSEIEGVSFDAVEDGLVVFDTTKRKYGYTLFGECSEERLNVFFDGFEQVPLPKSEQKVKEDWREGKQDPRVLKFLKRGGSFAFDAVTVISSFLSISSSINGMPFALISLVCWVSALVLCVVLPQYFTPISKKTRVRMGYKTYAKDMVWPLIFAPGVLALSVFERFTVIKATDHLLLAAIGIAAAIALCTLMYRLCTDFKKHFTSVVIVAVFSAFGFFGAAGYVNYYADFDKSYTDYTVLELTIDDGNYYCIVNTADGKAVHLKLKTSQFDSLKEGDTVRAYIGTGALGVEYACVDDA